MATSTKTIQYRYDGVGNRVGMTDPDGGAFTYAYDSLNRIAHLENPQTDRTTYQYDAAGRRTVKKLANGTRASFSYDAANNLTRLANLKSDGTSISSFDYTYDNVGNRTRVLEADGSRVTWSYDPTYQLSNEHRTGSNPYRNTFTYDPAGNRTLKNEDTARTTYAYDAANQLKTSQDSLGTTTYTFDADGNQQIVQPPTGNRTTTVWDYENRTTLVDLSSGLRNTMAYEPDGLRVKLEDSTGTKKFIWDDQNCLAETDASDVTQVVYTNEPGQYGNLISQRRSGNTNWYHFDAIGSTREMTISGEGISDTYSYDAWGQFLTSTGATINPFRYVGKVGYYFDVDSENNYVRARIYEPTIARWWSVDPLWFDSQEGLYLYALNAPQASVDPSGYGAIAPPVPVKEVCKKIAVRGGTKGNPIMTIICCTPIACCIVYECSNAICKKIFHEPPVCPKPPPIPDPKPKPDPEPYPYPVPSRCKLILQKIRRERCQNGWVQCIDSGRSSYICGLCVDYCNQDFGNGRWESFRNLGRWIDCGDFDLD